MVFGRSKRRASGDTEEVAGDPTSLREAGVVRLEEGPMLVERLRDRGVEAVGIESIDPATGARSYMRIMVRQADLAAARLVVDEPSGDDEAGEALDEMAGAGSGDDEEADEEAEEASLAAMSQLFVAADRLAGRPGDAELMIEVEHLGGLVADGPPPFGVERVAWTRVATLATAVVTADEESDGDEVQEAASALRDFLRSYV